MMFIQKCIFDPSPYMNDEYEYICVRVYPPINYSLSSPKNQLVSDKSRLKLSISNMLNEWDMIIVLLG